MNGFLVIGRCSRDDVPMELCATREAALAVIEALTPEHVIGTALLSMQVEVKHVINLGIIQFINGIPGRIEIIKDFDAYVEADDISARLNRELEEFFS